MIGNMLKKENIRIVEQVADWKDAISESLAPLVTGNYVTKDYEENIIKLTMEYGPYYVLAENIALIHGRPEMGVLKKQLAVTLLREPVKFSDNGYPVRLLVALAATDSESHLQAMKILANIFSNPGAIAQIIKAATVGEVYQCLEQAEEQV